MSEAYINWDGDEWQTHLTRLLKRRYSPGEFQVIPDRDRGDLGMEGFTQSGVGFQFYAAQEPLAVEELTEKQKTKIRKDIKKLCDNHEQIGRLLGLVRLSKWVLIVPRFDSKNLLVYAKQKAAEVRAKNLPILTADFTIIIETDQGFEVEREALKEAYLAKIPLRAGEADPAELNIWTQSNSELVQTLDAKLLKLKKSPETQQKLKAEMIRCFVQGQNALQLLHANYPDVAKDVRDCKLNKERFLCVEALTSTALPIEFMQKVLKTYEERLAQEVKGITSSTAELLAHEAIADWLLRCPLDFEG